MDTDEDYSHEAPPTEIDDEPHQAIKNNANPHFRSLLHGNDLFDSFSQQNLDGSTANFEGFEESHDASQYAIPTQGNTKVSFTIKSEQKNENNQFSNDLFNSFSQQNLEGNSAALGGFEGSYATLGGFEGSHDMSQYKMPAQGNAKISFTLKSEQKNKDDQFSKDLFNSFSQQNLGGNTATLGGFEGSHDLLGKSFSNKMGHSYGFSQHTHQPTSKITFTQTGAKNNDEILDFTDSYRPEQQQLKVVSNTMDTYSPEQQHLTEVSKTVNPYYAKQTTGNGFISGSTSNQVLNLPSISDLLSSGGGHQINLPTTFSSRFTKTESSADINKALYLMHFLTSIGNKDVSQVSKSFGNTGIIQLLSRQPAKLIRPIIRFIAVQKSSPHNHWEEFLTTMKSKNSAEAYMTLMKQINAENHRQSYLMRKLRLLTSQMKQRQVECLPVRNIYN